MSRFGAQWSERAELLRLAIDCGRRNATARLRRSALLRWRYGPPHADQLLILPQDIRAADPSFAREVAEGQFGLAGSVAAIGTRSPFDIPPVSRAWARELHGFAWLKHLRAAHTDDAESAARHLVLDWIAKHRQRFDPVAFEPDVVARRVMSWIANAPMLLDDIEPQTYATMTDSLGSQIAHLGASAHAAPPGYPRLLAAIALTFAGLCVSGHARRLDHAIRLLTRELRQQIHPDGGHISRNPAIVVEVLLDVLPLRHCFVARQIEPPEAFKHAIGAMTQFLHAMRLGDGNVARFNGVGPARHDEVAMVLAYVDSAMPQAGLLPQSRYVRLSRGRAIVVMDAGGPPMLALSGSAQAGCLSFEVSFGERVPLVNGGMPAAMDPSARHAARSTASHNTLCLSERSSAVLVRDRLIEHFNGLPALRFPGQVHVLVEDDTGGGARVTASHDGYEPTFGLVHTRTLTLSPDGRRLDGIDRLAGRSGILRLKRDIPFALHFHLQPEAGCRVVSANEIELSLGGDAWLFCSAGGTLTVEESVYYAAAAGPLQSLQIVLRGATAGETQIEWSLSTRSEPHDDAGPKPDAA